METAIVFVIFFGVLVGVRILFDPVLYCIAKVYPWNFNDDE